MSIEKPSIDRPSDHLSTRFGRLTPLEVMFMRIDTPEWPGHFAGLAVVDGEALLDASGKLRMGEIRDRLNRRLTRLPRLRRRVHFPGRFRGRPLWVDDGRFDVGHHVYETALESPGSDVQLLEAASEIYGRLLDRGRPLWEIWFLTGVRDGRIGVLLKLHHSVADGLAAVAIMGSLFDLEPDAVDPEPAPWTPEPVPDGLSLLADNVSSKLRTVGHAIAGLAHPERAFHAVQVFTQVVRKILGVKGAPQTSLNAPVRAGRRVRFLRLDLASMKGAAHAHGGKVNDVVLTLWSGGLRDLLASRGELVAGVEPTTSVAVSTRSASDGTVGNQVGTIVLPLPVSEAAVHRRLDLVISTTRRTKARQRPAAIMDALVGLLATPVGRYLLLRQRATNVMSTNVIGPPVATYFLGARVLDIFPIVDLTGNIGLSLCAFTYAGQVFLVVTADAAAFPDLDVLMAGMERDWLALVDDDIVTAVRHYPA